MSNTKAVYFGKYSPQEVADLGINTYQFLGEMFEYKMVLRAEDGAMCIYDSYGRPLPFDKTHFAELILAVQLASKLQAVEDFKQAVCAQLDNTPDIYGIV